MFLQIFWFDFKCNLKRKSTWLFFIAFFLASVAYIAVEGGLVFDVPYHAIAYFNSARSFALILNGIVNNSLLGTIVLITIMAPAIQKDFQYNSHSIYFTKPISKFGYVVGRFMSAFLTALLAVMGSVLAFVVMCNLPIYPPGRVGSYDLWNYLQGFVYLIIPNAFFVGVLFFSIVTYTRNMMSGYIASIVLLMLLNNDSLFPDDIDPLIMSLKDPYGTAALSEVTKYWSPVDENKLAIPFTADLLYNRILWLAVSGMLFLFTYWRFNFQHYAPTFSLFRKKKTDTINEKATTIIKHLPKVTSIFDTALSIKQWVSLTRLEFKNLVKSWYFIIILLLPSVLMLLESGRAGGFGLRLLPTSFHMVDTILNFCRAYVDVIIVFYSGALVWRERNSKTEEIISATPIKTWVLQFSKIASLIGMYVAIIIYFILFFIFFQIANGFTDIQPFVYIQSLLGYNLVNIVILACFTVSVQVLVNNRYLGYLICIVIMVLLPLAFNKLGIETRLVQFNSAYNLPYSDMNGFGHRFLPFMLYKFYWLAFSCLLLTTANLMWSRGNEHSFKSRLIVAKYNVAKIHLLSYVLGLSCMIFFGSFIYYNTRVLYKFHTVSEMDEQTANFEKKYKKYEALPKLKIIDVNVQLAIYPETRSMEVNGAYWIKNKGTRNVDSLFFKYNENYRNFKIEVLNNSLTEVIGDSICGVKVLKFGKTIIAGDSLQLKFSYRDAPRGFKHGGIHTGVFGNGTYLTSKEVFPNISYDDSWELTDSIKRITYNLKPGRGTRSFEDSLFLKNNYVSPDADWIRYECTISTNSSQTAVSSGDLVRKWTENKRNYFHYKMNVPALMYLCFQSGKYEVKASKWKDVNIEIYHDKHHGYNTETMINGVKKSLEYYNNNFSSYPFKQLRIVEFPRYMDGGQGFANMITFSEGRDFIAAPEFGNKNSVNCFFTTAHEVAHQWWGHQVVGANVEGNALIGESLAEYSALRVLEKEFGEKVIHTYLKYELDNYLTERTKDNSNEEVLLFSQEQPYVYYNKAAIVLYAISDLIGEQEMNKMLKAYIARAAFQQAPYTTSLEFETLLKAATPDSLKYAIVDGFEKITFYENRTKDVSFVKLPSGKYKVSITIDAMKLYADEKGKTTSANMNDYIDIGIFGKGTAGSEPIELYNGKFKIKSGLNTFEFSVDSEPYEAGIDPYFKLIDRTTDDNVRKVNDKKPLKNMSANERGL